jgi:hypothetical protein
MRFIHHSPSPLGSLRDGDQDHATDYGAKPDGLWFSVGNVSDCGSDWRALCEERAKTDGWSLDCLKYQTEIFFAKDANILWIQDAVGIDSLTAEYGRIRRDGRQSVDWHRIAKEFEGIIISPMCHDRRDYEQARWYACWQCSSGCVWQARAVQTLRPLNYSAPGWNS